MKNKRLPIIFLISTIIVSAILNIYFWKKNKENENELAELKSEIEKLNDDYLTLDANLVSLNDLNVAFSREVEMFRNPDNKTYFLNAIHPLAKDSKAILIWNQKDKSILLSCEGLPKISDKTQYQLWALRGGKYYPVIDLPRILNGNFLDLETITEKAETYIITLEEAGENSSSIPSETYLSGSL